MVGGLAIGGLGRLMVVVMLLLVLAMKFLPLGGGLGWSLGLPLAREGVPFLEKATIFRGSLCQNLLHQVLREKSSAPKRGINEAVGFMAHLRVHEGVYPKRSSCVGELLEITQDSGEVSFCQHGEELARVVVGGQQLQG